MTRPPLVIAFLISPLMTACGGGAPSDPPATTPPAAAAETKSATPDLAAPPPNTVGPALTPPPGAETLQPKADMTKKAAPPERPAFTRTDLQIGTGLEAIKGKELSVNYTGWLYDPTKPDLKGRMFDSSMGRGPFSFVLGKGQVIPGWDEGFTGMKVGGKRRLIIPPNLAYGVDGAGGGIIPPNATLIFEMELLSVQN
jgi:FKBP-type peptidyl-prolyl cis-trans isomerase FkpA